VGKKGGVGGGRVLFALYVFVWVECRPSLKTVKRDKGPTVGPSNYVIQHTIVSSNLLF